MVITPVPVQAAFGPYEHGYGIKSMGYGGVGVVGGEESYTLAANPALASGLNQRYDLGVDWIQVQANASIHGNLLGADQRYSSDDRHYFIPQFGFVLPLTDRLTVGMTGLAVGLGTDYDPSPLERFGNQERTQLTLGLTGASSVVSYQLTPEQAIGLGLNLSYQLLNTKGLPKTLALFSQSPEHFTNQGFDGALGVGFCLGWHARLAPWLEVGASYRSKTWSQRFHDYAGLLPDGGRLEFPANYSLGLAVDLPHDWSLAVETQHVFYSRESTTGNDLDQLRSGNRFGSAEGPGFGWNDLSIYKIGVAWQASPEWRFRAGYSQSNQLIPRSETLLNSLAPITFARHVTSGLTYSFGSRWELTAYAALAFREKVRGEDSIPLLVGGGEADIWSVMYLSGISLGRNFDP